MTAVVTIPVTRSFTIDRVRGVAITLMVLDHILELTHTGMPIRYTLTRLSMPLFFLISGHLVRRVTWRTYAIGIVGFFLPLAIPWIDNPNVLLAYAFGAMTLSILPPLPLAVIGLTISANHFDIIGNSYGLGSLLALMALGKIIPRSSFDWATHVPSFFSTIGRYPLTIYIVHLFILQGLFS